MNEKIHINKAWLVTRHWRGDYPKSEVAVIFSARLGAMRVREFVELLGVTTYHTLREQAAMQWPSHGKIPHAAQTGQTKHGRAPGECEIFWDSGGDPYLYARLVDDLIVNGDGAVWKERPRPQIALSASFSAE